MSHANYCFLFDYDHGEESEEAIREYATSQFELYAEHHCDENNWYHLGGIITGDDRAILCEWKDWPDEWKTFDQVQRFALGCVATDMEVMGASPYGWLQGNERQKLDDLSFLDLLKVTLEDDVPKRIIEKYQEHSKTRDMDDYKSWKRRKLVTQYEYLVQSDVKPFSGNWLPPYDYRCFDIRDGRGVPLDKSRNGILIVDIHA